MLHAWARADGAQAAAKLCASKHCSSTPGRHQTSCGVCQYLDLPEICVSAVCASCRLSPKTERPSQWFADLIGASVAAIAMGVACATIVFAQLATKGS